MSVYKKGNKFKSYLIILVALFILVLVTKTQISVFQERLDLNETHANTLLEKKARLEKLNAKKNELDASSEDIDKYIVDIKEDELIDYIYSFVEDNNDSQGVSIIKSLSISEPQDTEMGFKETIINLNIMIPNDKKLQELFDFLTGDDSKYNFFVTSLSFPYGKEEGGYNVSIPLKVLHK